MYITYLIIEVKNIGVFNAYLYSNLIKIKPLVLSKEPKALNLVI